MRHRVTLRAREHLGLLLLLEMAVFGPRAAHAQVIQSITPGTPDLGRVVSGASGNTVFRVAPSSGTIIRVSGTGVRLSTGTSRALVTIACNQKSCANTAINVRVGSIGSPTGRMAQLTNFLVAAGTASFSTNPSGTDPVSFTLNPVGSNGGTITFYVGADVTILGNASASSTGNATASFYVYIAPSGTTPTLATTSGPSSGTALASVLRPITVSNSAPLAFGRIVRPSSGNSTVAIAAATGTRTVTGSAIALGTPSPTRATYSIAGEGGQAVSLSIPASLQMTGPGTALTVSLTSTASGAQVLGGALGSAGSLAFTVGGSFTVSNTTVTGAYQGSYAVSVQYN